MLAQRAVSRNITSWVIAAGLVGLTTSEIGTFGADLETLLTQEIGTNTNNTIVESHDNEPNNHGTMAGAARVAIGFYLDDLDVVFDAADTFKRWTGEIDGADFSGAGMTCWSYDPAGSPTGLDRGINAVGAEIEIQGEMRNVDGVLWDDQRRCGNNGGIGCPCCTTCTDDCETCGEEGEDHGGLRWDFCPTPPTCTPEPDAGPWKQGYFYEGLQGAVVQAWIYERAQAAFGLDDPLPAFDWGSSAIKRAYEWLENPDELSTPPAGGYYPPSDDDLFQTWIVESTAVYGDFLEWLPVHNSSGLRGKNMGFTDWTHAP